MRVGRAGEGSKSKRHQKSPGPQRLARFVVLRRAVRQSAVTESAHGVSSPPLPLQRLASSFAELLRSDQGEMNR